MQSNLYLKWDLYARQNDIVFRRYCRNFVGYGFEVFVETAIVLCRRNGEAIPQSDLMEELNEVTYIDLAKIKECLEYMIKVGLLKKDENGNLYSSRILKDVAENNAKSEIPVQTTEPKKTKNKIFVKPTIEEIANYCQERKNGINAQEFYDFYEARGWIVGKTHMKNWQAAVRTWENSRIKEKDSGKHICNDAKAIQDSLCPDGSIDW